MTELVRQQKAIELASQREIDPQSADNHLYPNGGAVRTLAYDIAQKSANINRLLQEADQVPPWVMMLMSQASFCIDHVERYLSYYGATPSRYAPKGKRN
jgi:anthranilate/para-aminobenzoate synthase component I